MSTPNSEESDDAVSSKTIASKKIKKTKKKSNKTTNKIVSSNVIQDMNNSSDHSDNSDSECDASKSSSSTNIKQASKKRKLADSEGKGDSESDLDLECKEMANIDDFLIINTASFSQKDFNTLSRFETKGLKLGPLKDLCYMILQYNNQFNQKKNSNYKCVKRSHVITNKDSVIAYLNKYESIWGKMLPHLQIEKTSTTPQKVSIAKPISIPRIEDKYPKILKKYRLEESEIVEDTKVAIFSESSIVVAYGKIIKNASGELERNGRVNVRIYELLDSGHGYSLDEAYQINKQLLVNRLHIIKEAFVSADEYLKSVSNQSEKPPKVLTNTLATNTGTKNSSKHSSSKSDIKTPMHTNDENFQESYLRLKQQVQKLESENNKLNARCVKALAKVEDLQLELSELESRNANFELMTGLHNYIMKYASNVSANERAVTSLGGDCAYKISLSPTVSKTITISAETFKLVKSNMGKAVVPFLKLLDDSFSFLPETSYKLPSDRTKARSNRVSLSADQYHTILWAIGNNLTLKKLRVKEITRYLDIKCGQNIDDDEDGDVDEAPSQLRDGESTFSENN